MGNPDRWRLALLAALVLLLAFASLWQPAPEPVLAQSGGSYDVGWNTIDGGGVTFASGGAFTLGGSIGQPDAGVLAGGAYTLKGGFWPGAAGMAWRVYLPLVLRHTP